MSNSNSQLATNETQNKHADVEPIDQPELPSENRQFLPTLPREFKSLAGASIKIESEEPQDLIELLGNVLEVTDYKTNMASYWFLDTIALHVLQCQKDLDDHYLGILISWLTGEITLIRDKKYPREKFFEKMSEIFNMAFNKVSEENRLPYWDEILYEIDSSATEEGKEFSNGEKDQSESRLEVFTKNQQEKQRLYKINENERVPENTGNPQFATQANSEFSNNTDPVHVLEIVIESTYNMYANELRYYLVYKVFAEPIEVETFNIQFALRTPRPMKFTKLVPFGLGLMNNLNQEVKSKTKKRKKKIIHGPVAIPATPPPSRHDEVWLANKRQFILPLIESKDALKLIYPTDEA